MASTQVRRRGSSLTGTSLDAVLAASSSPIAQNSEVFEEEVPGPAPIPSPRVGRSKLPRSEGPAEFTLQPWKASATPVSTTTETFGNSSTRSSSSASRSANRLSLTLPIAPANSMPSRPTPISIPPTPTELAGSDVTSPIESNDFIVAIAAQERRVLELREELIRAENDLKTLKTKWNSSEGQRARAALRKREPLRSMTASADDTRASDSPAGHKSLDIERKKALLLGPATPREHRRRVLRGGHTRTLSLLSPTKTDNDISIHRDYDALRSPDLASKLSQPFTPTPLLSKRATWAPRQTPQTNGVKQIAQDFKYGLWTFVEDLRQATVGDEGISATSNRTSELAPRLNRSSSDQDTIRAPQPGRGRIPFSVDSSTQAETPRKASPGSFQDRASQHARSPSMPDAKPRKHFSWTPLTFDDMGDEDWSNWDSPSVKTARWSGSTVNGDIIPAVPERVDENEATLRKKRSRSDLRSPSPHTPGTLAEIPSALLNTFTPNNIKRFSSDFLKEWEKSLSPPAENTTFEPSFQSIKDETR